MTNKIIFIISISFILFCSAFINVFASEKDQAHCIVNDKGENFCFSEEENKPTINYGHDNCPH